MRNDDTVTASEIANWVYCLESFRLGAPGKPAGNQSERNRGTVQHARLDVAETVAGGSIALGRILIVLGLLAGLAAWLWG